MRGFPILLVLVFALAGCGGAGPQESTAAPVDEAARAPRLDFAAKQRIPVRLDMLATAEGGRAVSLPLAWRGEFAFDGGTRMRCGVDRGDHPEVTPGASHEVHLVCAGALHLPDDGGRGFRVVEDGHGIASGTVLP